MTDELLNGKILRQMFLAGARNLEKHAAEVDALNVFPVPDGDTGKNMNLTFQSGAEELNKSKAEGVEKVSATFSHGLLLGARGNSGVILSQLFRGFARGLAGLTSANGKQVADAFQQGVDMAYKAVMKPVEGTILTVARESARLALVEARRGSSPLQVIEALVQEARRALANTPNQLPVLKEVGVVDSGGQGLVYIFEGFLESLQRGETYQDEGLLTDQVAVADGFSPVITKPDAHIHGTEIEFGYCTEFMIHLPENKAFDEEGFKEKLSQIGDSLLVVSGEDFVKVHIHAEHPGEVLNYAQQFGMLDRMKIDNMRIQHNEVLIKQEGGQEPQETPTVSVKPEPSAPYGVLCVASGTGIAEIFRSLGVSVVIEGGQTMNPSTEDIVRAIESVSAKHIIILPNNKNIVMASQQAAELVSVPVTIIPSKSIPQGMSAMLAFNPAADPEENKDAMSEALTYVKSGSITYSVRDTKINDIPIHKGDFIGMADGSLISAAKEANQAALELLEEMVEDDNELITVIYGDEVKEGDVEALTRELQRRYPAFEIETHNGGQPVYLYLFSVE